MTRSKIIKVAVVDDHTLVREGLKLMLKQCSDIEVSIEASHGREFLDQLEENPVDVVLLDIEMPVLDGKSTLEQIRRHFSETRVIMLSMHQHESFIVHMMEIGADGYLPKESKPEEVINAIRIVHKDGVFFNPTTSKALLGRIMGDKSSKDNLNRKGEESLNQRELDILKLICEEKTTKQIADELFLSPKTIEGYRKSLLEKTGAKNVVGLVKYAMKHRLI